jgi:hypothetical protein
MKKLSTSCAVLTSFALSMVIFQTSCKKDPTTPNSSPHSIEGLWIGSYSVDGQPSLGEQYYSVVIKPDGTMIEDTKWSGKQHLSIGTWKLDHDTLNYTATCVYGLTANVGTTEKHAAIFDASKGTLSSGKWQNVPVSGSGTFTASRIN